MRWLILLAVACKGPEDTATPAQTTPTLPTSAQGTTPTSSSTPTPTFSSTTTPPTNTPTGDTPVAVEVIVGVYKEEGGTYVDTKKDLAIQIGVPCFTWSRDAKSDNHDTSSHQHYNAADDTSYADDSFTWTEYGPELSQGDIDATCAAGNLGITKAVNWTDYFEDHDGIFLRIKDVIFSGSDH